MTVKKFHDHSPQKKVVGPNEAQTLNLRMCRDLQGLKASNGRPLRLSVQTLKMRTSSPTSNSLS